MNWIVEKCWFEMLNFYLQRVFLIMWQYSHLYFFVSVFIWNKGWNHEWSIFCIISSVVDRIKWNRYANNKKPDKMSHLYLDLFWHDFPFIFSGEVQLMNYGCISRLHLAKSIWPCTWIEIIRNLLQLCCLIERFLKWRWLVHVLLDLMQLKN